MQDYFLNKFGWDTLTFANMDWDSSEREYQRLFPGHCLVLNKLVLTRSNLSVYQQCRILTQLIVIVYIMLC